MKTIELKKVLEVAYDILSDDDFTDLKNELCKDTHDIKVGSKVKFKDNLSRFAANTRQVDREKYNNMEVTIESIYYDDEGEIDTFFIEEDNCFFEWSLEFLLTK